MATPLGISSGEQTITATGAVTGSLSTNGLPKTGWLHIRIRGLQPGQSIRVAIEDTANVTPFSDATTVWNVDTASAAQTAAIPENEAEYGIELFRLPDIRFGGTLNLLRANVTAITASTTVLLEAWLEQ